MPCMSYCLCEDLMKYVTLLSFVDLAHEKKFSIVMNLNVLKDIAYQV